MILVTGGTGTVGQATVRALKARGRPFKVATRDPGRVKANGIRAVEFDFERPDTVARALERVNHVFLLTPATEKQEEYVHTAVMAAKRTGVKHVVRLSVTGADMEPGIALSRVHRACDDVVRASGLSWTLLRPASFMQNFVNYYGVKPGADATIRQPHGDGRVSWVDARDVGEVAAAALTVKAHEGRTYELSGPEPLSDAEAAAILSEALGRTCAYADVPDAAARDGMLGVGMSPWSVDALMELNAVIRQGHAAGVSDGVQEVLGRAPRSFRDYARDLAAGAA